MKRYLKLLKKIILEYLSILTTHFPVCLQQNRKYTLRFKIDFMQNENVV